MKVKLWRKTIKELKGRFSLHRKYHPTMGWMYSIRKDGVFFNPYGMLGNVKFSYDVLCTENEAIEYLRETIRADAFRILHAQWMCRNENKKDVVFDKRWRDKI